MPNEETLKVYGEQLLKAAQIVELEEIGDELCNIILRHEGKIVGYIEVDEPYQVRTTGRADEVPYLHYSFTGHGVYEVDDRNNMQKYISAFAASSANIRKIASGGE